MKTKEILILLPLLAMVICSCEKNDPVDDWASIGHVTPTTYWEIPSSTVSAGSNVAFTAQFYSSENIDIDHMEVWYDVNEHITLEATCPSVTFTYTKSVDVTSLIREFQKIASYEFKEEFWNSDKRAYVTTASFPSSNTLKPIEWSEITEFDAEKYATVFPDTFATVFQRDLYVELEKQEKYSDFRKLMVDLEVMTTDEFRNCTDSVFDENSQQMEYFIKDDSKEYVKGKYFAIPFEELTFDKSNMIYKLEYLKAYKLNAAYKVFDKAGNIGVSEKKEIDLI